jgi:hypothetical protein
MFGGSATAPPDAGAISGAEFLLGLAKLITNREEVASEIARFADERAAAERALAEVQQRETELLHREQQAAAHEQALQVREADVAERERQAQAQLQRAEEATASLMEMRAELKQKLAA